MLIDGRNRIVVSEFTQALVEDLDLVTGDEVLRSYPIRTIW